LSIEAPKAAPPKLRTQLALKWVARQVALSQPSTSIPIDKPTE